MTLLNLFVILTIGVLTVSGYSLQPQQCTKPCAPPPSDELTTPCQDQCQTNWDCGRRGLCCAGCHGCKVCQQGAPVDSCRRKICPPGQVCVDTPIFCKKPPCPQARCVEVSTKPGTCPRYRCLMPFCPSYLDKCRTDSDCKGSDKCCRDCTGCKTCLPAQGVPNSCSSAQCPGGEVCIVGSDGDTRCVCEGPLANCFVAPCRFARCDNHPNATCSDNYCGGCHAVWRENGRIVTDCVRLQVLS